jgi:hypothetical protein
MNLKECERKRSFPNFEAISRNFPEGTEESNVDSGQESRYLGRDSNRVFPKYNSEAFPLSQIARMKARDH